MTKTKAPTDLFALLRAVDKMSADERRLYGEARVQMGIRKAYEFVMANRPINCGRPHPSPLCVCYRCKEKRK